VLFRHCLCCKRYKRSGSFFSVPQAACTGDFEGPEIQMGNKTEYKVIKAKGELDCRLVIKGKIDMFLPPMEREVEALIAKMKAKKGEEQGNVIMDCTQFTVQNTDTINLFIYFLEEFINTKLRRHAISCTRLVADVRFQKLLSDKGLERIIDISMELPGTKG